MQFSPASYYFIPLQCPVLPLMSEIKFHTHTKLKAKLQFFILIFVFLDSRGEGKRFWAGCYSVKFVALHHPSNFM
jgi:hypothetical protein